MNWSHVSDLTWWQWALLGVVLLTQSIYIFQDAQKRGAKAWLWGLYGLTSVPTAYIVYWVCVVRKRKPKIN
jgi:uncharacterized membrane protein